MRLIEADGDSQTIWEAPEKWKIDPGIIADWLQEAVPAISHTALSAISVIDFSAIVIDGSMPRVLREKIVDQVNHHMSNSNLSGLIVPDILAGSIGASARPLGAASLPLSRRFMLET